MILIMDLKNIIFCDNMITIDDILKELKRMNNKRAIEIFSIYMIYKIVLEDLFKLELKEQEEYNKNNIKVLREFIKMINNDVINIKDDKNE